MAVEGGLLFQAFLLFSRLLITFDFKACSKNIIYIVLKSDGANKVEVEVASSVYALNFA